MAKPAPKATRGGIAAADSTVTTLAIAALVAVGISMLVNWGAGRKPWQATAGDAPVAMTSAPATTGSTTPAPAATTVAATQAASTPATSSAAPAATAKTAPAPAATQLVGGARWAASATGRIEPKDGELRLVAPLPGRIVEVLVKANEQVFKGDLLVRLDDEDALLKVTAATAEADVRRRERDEEPATGLALERRKAQDAAADAEREQFHARMAFDAVTSRLKAGKATADDIAKATRKLNNATEAATQARAKLVEVLAKPGMPLPTRLESSLETTRTDVATAEALVEKMRLRAPYDGVALAVNAKVGEYATPNPELPLVTFGDLSSLRVRAEVEERDATKVRVGQKVVIRADAFPGVDFSGVVTSVAKSMGPPRMTARGPRRPNDVEVLEVMAALDGTPPLLTGMRVDVYFKLDDTASAADKK